MGRAACADVYATSAARKPPTRMDQTRVHANRLTYRWVHTPVIRAWLGDCPGLCTHVVARQLRTQIHAAFT